MSLQYIQPLERTMRTLGGRWRTVLLYLLLDGPKRFSELQRSSDISRRMLTVNLRALEEAGLVMRTTYAEVPPRVEYELTPEGMELRPLINDLYAWGERLGRQQ